MDQVGFGGEDLTPMQPLIGGSVLSEAAESMLAASRALLAAASTIAPGASGETRARELTADAVESGFLRALRRDSLLSDANASAAAPTLFGIPASGSIPGAGYGRMGANVTGSGSRSQLYGTIGGAVGFAVGGPVGAFVGGMLGGLFGGDDSDTQAAQQQQDELRRQWLKTPEGFETEAYLYNLMQGQRTSGIFSELAKPAPAGGRGSSQKAAPNPVMVSFSPGAVQITGTDAAAGERAARAFAGELGRVLRLNSVVVPAAGFAGEV